ncbi:uncharacterized protein LOC135205221 [Macrobrachium nipponense]|uniref:uncharacterized protein LOC135205221 n=1 Tax=Macrobrachium nipponense TaxID=159736 RepID=UPI0030C8C1D2
MKVAVLLALVGLASCRMALIGGDRAKDVTIKYSYLDENGKTVEVEVEADRLGLQLTPKAAPAPPAVPLQPTPVAVRYVQQAAAQPATPVLTKRFLQVAPEPVFAPSFFVPQPQVVTRYVPVAAPSAPAPRYVKVDFDDVEDDDDDVRRVVYRPASSSRTVAPATVAAAVPARRASRPAARPRASDDDSAED